MRVAKIRLGTCAISRPFFSLVRSVNRIISTRGLTPYSKNTSPTCGHAAMTVTERLPYSLRVREDCLRVGTPYEVHTPRDKVLERLITEEDERRRHVGSGNWLCLIDEKSMGGYD